MYKKDTKNTTDWNTDDLLKIIKRCAEYRGVDLTERLRKKYSRTWRGTNEWKKLRIQHSKSRHDGAYTGRCYSRSGEPHPDRTGNIYLGVPKSTKYEDWKNTETEKREFNKERFAQVVLHEIDHLLGLSHSEMMDSSELSTPDLSDIEVRVSRS